MRTLLLKAMERKNLEEMGGGGYTRGYIDRAQRRGVPSSLMSNKKGTGGGGKDLGPSSLQIDHGKGSAAKRPESKSAYMCRQRNTR